MIDIERIWPGWQIEELIGQGAYGKVYRIRREEMGDQYYAALKVIEIPADDAEVQTLITMGMDNLSIRDYFEGTARSITNEIKLMESLKSAPNVVYIEEHYLEEHKDSIGWTILIRMELLESLRKYQRRVGDPDISETVTIGKQICDAISCCESKRIIHRDIKPENIFRNEFGIYKLGDFGIARQMESTKSAYSQKGTSAYMAPEVNRGDKYDNTVDIYSLGIMLYQFLNKQRMPFLPTDSNKLTPPMLEEAQYRRLSGEPLPDPCDAPPALAKIILKACDPNPSRRYRNAAQFKEALSAWENGTAPEASQEPETETGAAKGAPLHWASQNGGENRKQKDERKAAEQQRMEQERILAQRRAEEERTKRLEEEQNRLAKQFSKETSKPSGQKPAAAGSASKKTILIAAAAAVVVLIAVIAILSGRNKKNTDSSGTTAVSSENASFVTESSNAEPTASEPKNLGSSVMSHVEFSDASQGSIVTVEAYVQAKSTFIGNAFSAFLQNEDGAYYVYQMACTEEEYSRITEGTSLLITGTKSVWEGETEITDASFEILDGTWIAEPLDITDICDDETELPKHMNEKFILRDMILYPWMNDSGQGSTFVYGWNADGSREDNSDVYFNAGLYDIFTFNVESDFFDNTTEVYQAVESMEIWKAYTIEGFIYWFEDTPSFQVTSVVPSDGVDQEMIDEYRQMFTAHYGMGIAEASSEPFDGAVQVSFHGSGAELGLMRDVYVGEESVMLPACTFELPGFEFNGWLPNDYEAANQNWCSSYDARDEEKKLSDQAVVQASLFKQNTKLRALWKIVPEHFESDPSMHDKITVEEIGTGEGLFYITNQAGVPVDVYMLHSFYKEDGSISRTIGELTSAIPPGGGALLTTAWMVDNDSYAEKTESKEYYVREALHEPFENRFSVSISAHTDTLNTVTVTNTSDEPISFLHHASLTFYADGRPARYAGGDDVSNYSGEGTSLQPGESTEFYIPLTTNRQLLLIGDEHDHVMHGSMTWDES